MPTSSPLLTAPGTYAFLLQYTGVIRTARIGGLGHLQLEPGFYVYIGSAYGPGGIAARVGRHCRRNKPKRWHIDYLRWHCRTAGIWACYDPQPVEHLWARILSSLPGITQPMPGFGASDCDCPSHLFHGVHAPERDTFYNAVLELNHHHGPIHMHHCQQ